MEVKLFEVRDRMTFIAVVAVLMRPSETAIEGPAEHYLLRRSGYALDELAPRLVALGRADADGSTPFCYDPFAWRNRTLCHAHEYIATYWDVLVSGAVIDVEYILGETRVPKMSERRVRMSE
jgi:hypothetical protein